MVVGTLKVDTEGIRLRADFYYVCEHNLGGKQTVSTVDSFWPIHFCRYMVMPFGNGCSPLRLRETRNSWTQRIAAEALPKLASLDQTRKGTTLKR